MQEIIYEEFRDIELNPITYDLCAGCGDVLNDWDAYKIKLKNGDKIYDAWLCGKCNKKKNKLFTTYKGKKLSKEKALYKLINETDKRYNKLLKYIGELSDLMMCVLNIIDEFGAKDYEKIVKMYTNIISKIKNN